MLMYNLSNLIFSLPVVTFQSKPRGRGGPAKTLPTSPPTSARLTPHAAAMTSFLPVRKRGHFTPVHVVLKPPSPPSRCIHNLPYFKIPLIRNVPCRRPK